VPPPASRRGVDGEVEQRTLQQGLITQDHGLSAVSVFAMVIVCRCCARERRHSSMSEWTLTGFTSYDPCREKARSLRTRSVARSPALRIDDI